MLAGPEVSKVRAAHPSPQLEQRGPHGEHGLEWKEGICGSAVKRSVVHT